MIAPSTSGGGVWLGSSSPAALSMATPLPGASPPEHAASAASGAAPPAAIRDRRGRLWDMVSSSRRALGGRDGRAAPGGGRRRYPLTAAVGTPLAGKRA